MQRRPCFQTTLTAPQLEVGRELEPALTQALALAQQQLSSEVAAVLVLAPGRVLGSALLPVFLPALVLALVLALVPVWPAQPRWGAVKLTTNLGVICGTTGHPHVALLCWWRHRASWLGCSGQLRT